MDKEIEWSDYCLAHKTCNSTMNYDLFSSREKANAAVIDA